MTALLLVRARLRRDASAAAIAPLLVPGDAVARTGAAHRLVWSLFADGPGRTRDFLWRETAPGAFIALAARPPADRHELFALDWKPFAPELRAGQRLAFSLRANPVVAVPRARGQRGRRHDVIMNALHPLALEARAGERTTQRIEEAPATRARAAAHGWLVRQGEHAGFTVGADDLGIDGYEPVRIPRAGAPPIRFARVDFDGVLTVRDPAAFLARLAAGFGAAKAFGCGLMLIRRPRAGAAAA